MLKLLYFKSRAWKIISIFYQNIGFGVDLRIYPNDEKYLLVAQNNLEFFKL